MKVERIEAKTSQQGKNYKQVHLSDGRRASLWSDNPLYHDLIVGSEVMEDDLVQKGNYWNFKSPTRVLNQGYRAPTGIAKAQERKADYIKEAQERKSESIAYFNSVNSAIALYAADIKSEVVAPDDAGTKEYIREWRDWFLSEWEKYEGKMNPKNPSQIDEPPFESPPDDAFESF